MGSLKQMWAIIKKDIIAELRTKEMLSSMLLFILCTMVIFHFSFGTEENNLTAFGGGLLWLAFLFMSLLGLNRSLVHEKDEGCLEGILLSPIDRPFIYLAKMLGNLIFLTIVEIPSVFFFTIFFIQHNYLPDLGYFIIAVVLGTIGISAVGTLLATISVNTKTREMMLPILFFPIITPLLMWAVPSTGQLLAGPKQMDLVISQIKYMAIYDIIFLLLGYALYDFVIGE